MSDSTSNDRSTQAQDTSSGFDPESHLISDGEFNFDLPGVTAGDFDQAEEQVPARVFSLRNPVFIMVVVSITIGGVLAILSRSSGSVSQASTTPASSVSRPLNSTTSQTGADINPLIIRGISTCEDTTSIPRFPLVLADVGVAQGIALLRMSANGKSCTVSAFRPSVYHVDLSPSRTRIAVLYRNQSGSAHVLDVQTSRIVLQTTSDVYDMAWSPDESSLVIASAHTAQPDLYILRVGSDELTPLTNDPQIEISVAWSPDSSQLAYVTQTTNDAPNIHLLDIASGNRTPLPLHADEVLWSPRGDQLALREGDSTLLLVDLPFEQGDTPTRINLDSPVNAMPAWSPTGLNIVFTTETGVFLYHLEQRTFSPVTLPDRVTRVIDADW